jgi:hypothetical protein
MQIYSSRTASSPKEKTGALFCVLRSEVSMFSVRPGSSGIEFSHTGSMFLAPENTKMFLVAMFGNKLWLLLSLTDAESSKE